MCHTAQPARTMKRTETCAVTFFEATSAEWAGGSFIRELPQTVVQTSIEIGTHLQAASTPGLWRCIRFRCRSSSKDLIYRGSSSGCGGGVFDSRVLTPREKEMAQMDVEAGYVPNTIGRGWWGEHFQPRSKVGFIIHLSGDSLILLIPNTANDIPSFENLYSKLKTVGPEYYYSTSD